jgi:thiamine biosynthesis protein ThiS
MKVDVDGKEIELPRRDATVTFLLETLGINVAAVVVAVNGEISLEETSLKDGDSVRLISTVSGG